MYLRASSADSFNANRSRATVQVQPTPRPQRLRRATCCLFYNSLMSGFIATTYYVKQFKISHIRQTRLKKSKKTFHL